MFDSSKFRLEGEVAIVTGAGAAGSPCRTVLFPSLADILAVKP